MARLLLAFLGVTGVLIAAKLCGAPISWFWALSPLTIALSLTGLAALLIGALTLAALVATHRAEKRDGCLDEDEPPAVHRYVVARHATAMPRSAPVSRRTPFA